MFITLIKSCLRRFQCLIVGKKQDDNVLLVAFAKGDRSAAQQLTERLMPKIYSHAYYRLGNIADAEDVTQEAFFETMENCAKLENMTKRKFLRGSIAWFIICVKIATDEQLSKI